MKHLFLVVFLSFSNTSFACGKGGIPIDTEVRRYSLDDSVLEIKVAAPERYKNYKFSGAAYHKGDNLIPMNRGLSDLGKVFYYLKGKEDFFKNASIQIIYSYGVDRVLCPYKEKINLNSIIKEQL